MAKILFFLTLTMLLSACAAPVLPATPASLPPDAERTSTPPALPTTRLASPTPELPTAAPLDPSLTGLDGVYQDSLTGVRLNYPKEWQVIDVADETKKQSYAYAITFSSMLVQPSNKAPIPPELIKFDLAFTKTEAANLEQAAILQKQAWAAQDPAQMVTSERVFQLLNGQKAYRWVVQSMGDEAVIYFTYTPGYAVFLGGSRGDPTLIERIARTMQVAE